jgi:hypothetical protein
MFSPLFKVENLKQGNRLEITLDRYASSGMSFVRKWMQTPFKAALQGLFCPSPVEFKAGQTPSRTRPASVRRHTDIDHTLNLSLYFWASHLIGT